MLAAPLVFRAPEGPAAREARRPHFVRRRASKPARALRSLRRPPHRRRLRCCVVSARPCCRPRPPQPGPPDPPAPSTPAVLCCCVWLSASSRSPPWPRRRPSSFARNSLATISNIEFRSLQLQRFQTLLKFLPIELCARFLWSCPCRPSNVACNSLTALSNHEFAALGFQRFQRLLKFLSIELHATFLRPGSVATFGLRGQVLRLEVGSVPLVSAAPGVLPGVA